MLRISAGAIAVLLCFCLEANAQGGANCYRNADTQGCDPEGYGYETRTCPFNCTQADFFIGLGCSDTLHQTDWFARKSAFFDTITLLVPEHVQSGIARLEDLNVQGTFVKCLEEGSCHCEVSIDPFGNSGFICKREVEFQWEEYRPALTNTVCFFGMVYNCDDCQGDPDCEEYCSLSEVDYPEEDYPEEDYPEEDYPEEDLVYPEEDYPQE